jgi:hypothetical protein
MYVLYCMYVFHVSDGSEGRESLMMDGAEEPGVRRRM